MQSLVSRGQDSRLIRRDIASGPDPPVKRTV